jgi:uncharacterized protein with HEPN domain
MNHPERVEEFLRHIAEAIERATHYIQQLDSIDAFRQNRRDQDAVIRKIEIIGEAAARIQKHAPEFVASHPKLPSIEMRGMRNKMIHDHFDVDLSVVWNTVKEDLPRLREPIEVLLIELRREQE